jgi:hypothetical protein
MKRRLIPDGNPPKEKKAMRRILIPIVLLGIAATLGAAAAPGQQPPEERIPPFVKTVELHPGLPPLEIRVIPAAPSEDPKAPLGRVEIYRQGEPGPFQTITVTGEGYPIRLTFSEFEDANFDGYTDLLLCNTGGAKWGGYAIYFYDPGSGTFRQNGLSREMSERLQGNGLEFDRAAGEIRVAHLIFGCPEKFPVTETFVIQGGHLRRTGQEDLVRGEDGCYKVTRQILPNGAMEEISRERAPEHDGEE